METIFVGENFSRSSKERKQEAQIKRLNELIEHFEKNCVDPEGEEGTSFLKKMSEKEKEEELQYLTKAVSRPIPIPLDPTRFFGIKDILKEDNIHSVHDFEQKVKMMNYGENNIKDNYDIDNDSHQGAGHHQHQQQQPLLAKAAVTFF